MAIRGRRSFLNQENKTKQITLTLLLVFLTFSIVLVVPSTITKAAMEEKGINNNNYKATMEWNKTFENLAPAFHDDVGYCVKQTNDGGYIIVGETRDDTPGHKSDVWLIKTDSNGVEEWNQTFGTTYAGWSHPWNDAGYSVEQTTPDGGYIIVGEKYSGVTDSSDVWLIKTTSNGNEEWNKTYGGIEDDYGSCVAQTTDGGYIITGMTASYGAGDYDVWLIKTDSNGDHDWDETYGGIYGEVGYCVEQTTPDGGYIIVGYTNSFDSGYYDVWLIKTDTWGIQDWNKTYGGAVDDEGRCVEQTSDGGYIITGYTNKTTYYTGDVWLIKTDQNGEHVWNQTFGGESDDEGYCVRETTDQGYIIGGFTTSYDDGDYDVWLIKTDEYGNKVWDYTYGGTNLDKGYWVEQTIDGGYIITGYTESYGYYDTRDVWLIKVPQNPEVSEFASSTIFLALAVIGIVAMMVVLVKRKYKR